MQAMEQDMNIEQGSMLYFDNKNMSLGKIILRL